MALLTISISLRRTTIVDRQSAFDSILNNVNEKLLSNKIRLVKVHSLSGVTTDDLKEFGTYQTWQNHTPNDLRDKSVDEVIKNLLDLRLMIQGIRKLSFLL